MFKILIDKWISINSPIYFYLKQFNNGDYIQTFLLCLIESLIVAALITCIGFYTVYYFDHNYIEHREQLNIKNKQADK